jgi:hypothetical protein
MVLFGSGMLRMARMACWVWSAEGLLDDPGSWLGDDWWQSRIPEHDIEQDIDLEAF